MQSLTSLKTSRGHQGYADRDQRHNPGERHPQPPREPTTFPISDGSSWREGVEAAHHRDAGDDCDFPADGTV
jgi:hypothetical protein